MMRTLYIIILFISFTIYTHTHIYIYKSGVDGSVGQPKASKPEVPGSIPVSSCFSLVFIKNLINDQNIRQKYYYLYFIV